MREFLPTLSGRQKWRRESENVRVGYMVEVRPTHAEVNGLLDVSWMRFREAETASWPLGGDGATQLQVVPARFIISA